MVTRLTMVILAGMASGLQVDQIKLMDVRDDPFVSSYVSYKLHDALDLECLYTLAKGEQMSSVRWEVLKDGFTAGSLTWMPGQEGKATGLLDGLADLTRKDGKLFVQKPTYALGANYTCTVTTTDGSQDTASDEVLVVDVIENHYQSAIHPDKNACVLKAKMARSPMFPAPTVSLALYSISDSSFFKPLEMNRIYYPNGSVEVSFDGEIKIQPDFPQDFHMNFTVGLTKADGTYIPLVSQKSQTGNFDPSCANMSADANQTVTYNSHALNCFKAHITYFDPVKATVRCKEGFTNTTDVAEVEMYCNHDRTVLLSDYTWEPLEEGVLPHHLICEEDSAALDPAEPVKLVEPVQGGAETTTLSLTMLLPSLILCVLQDM